MGPSVQTWGRGWEESPIQVRVFMRKLLPPPQPVVQVGKCGTRPQRFFNLVFQALGPWLNSPDSSLPPPPPGDSRRRWRHRVLRALAAVSLLSPAECEFQEAAPRRHRVVHKRKRPAEA